MYDLLSGQLKYTNIEICQFMLNFIFHCLEVVEVDEALDCFQSIRRMSIRTTCGNFCFAESPLTNFAAADNFNNNSETPQNYQGKQPRYET